MSRFLVFGATGALGAATVTELRKEGHEVITVGRSHVSGCDLNLESPDWPSLLLKFGRIDGVVWAQGINSAGSVITTTENELLNAFDANVMFIARTLKALHDSGNLANPSRGVVISSMWQTHARANKFAYLVTKAALSGLVKSIAIDMAEFGFSINAVLPGVIDTPMTRANLTSDQIDRVESSTLGGKLAIPKNVARTISWLLSPNSEGLNSQFLTVDNGWTINRHV